MYVFLGLVYTPEDAQRLLKLSKVGLQGAANNYQWGLIRGLYSAGAGVVRVINSVPMGTYPKQCKVLFEKGGITYTPEAEVDSIGFVNLPLIKQWQRKNSVYRKLKKFVQQSEETVTVVAYSLYGPYLKAVKKLRKKYNNFRCVVVVPDLPGIYGIESGNPIIRLIQRIRGKSSLKCAKHADGYILLTEEMTQVMNKEQKPYVVVEGISNVKAEGISSYKRGEKPVVLYTGALEKALGLDTLIEAFVKLPGSDTKLCLAGTGGYVGEIKRICKEDPRIEYLGYVSGEEVGALQRKAAILVNPRSADDEYTKYSFPSKTMEYLSTGVPVVMNRLPGIPEEYHEYLFLAERSDADSMASKLQEVLQMDEAVLLAHGMRAVRFIQDEKSGLSQGKKVIKLAEQLQ